MMNSYFMRTLSRERSFSDRFRISGALRFEALERRTLLAITAVWLPNQTLDMQGSNETDPVDPEPAETEDFKVTAEQIGGAGPYYVRIYENECLPTCGIGGGMYNDPDFLVPIQNAPPAGLPSSSVVKMLIETWGQDDYVDLREVTSSRQFSFVPTWFDESNDAVTVYGGDGRDIIYGVQLAFLYAAMRPYTRVCSALI